MDIFRDNKNFILTWSALLLIMMIIFILSDQPTEQTNRLSMGVTERIIQSASDLAGDFYDTDISRDELHGLVRKLAHFLLFFSMGILATFAVGSLIQNKPKLFLTAAAICVIYAVSDEFHQKFVPGRSAVLTDVLIDTAGALTGIFFVIGIITASRILRSR